MKSTAKAKQRPGSRQQKQRAAASRRPPTAQPTAQSSARRLIPCLAAAGTLSAAAPLWPSPSSDPTWAGGVFFAAVAVAAYFVGLTAANSYGAGGVVTRTRNAVLLVLLVVVPLFVDLRIYASFSLAKLTVTLIGALAITAVWTVQIVRPGARPLWRNGLHWPVLALVAWTAVTTATSVNPRVSILGARLSYDGLVATAAFAIIFFAIAQTVAVNHVKAGLAVFYFGAGGLTVLYGLIQLHDRLLPGRPWDWLRIQGESTQNFAGGGIFSTFGNPNFLGGFLAVLAPVGLALLLLHRSRRLRALTLVIMLGMLAELLQSASRGALLATFVALGLAAALLWPDIRRRPTKFSVPALGALAASVVCVVVVLVAVPSSTTKFPTVLDIGPTLSLRTDIWKTGVAMANGRPLVGHGPDTWKERVSEYRGAEIVERHGPGVFSNSAHNIFVGQLAATGYPGLMLLLALLGIATMRGVGTWRRLRQVEGADQGDEASGARAARILLVAVGGGLVAYLIQACFNVSQVGLGFVFWVLLGLLCALSMAAGVPTSLRARALVGCPEAPPLLMTDIAQHPRLRRPVTQGAADGELDIVSGAVAVLACLGLVMGISFATRPHRADHNAWSAGADSASAVAAPPDKAEQLSRRAALRQRNSVALNPWEPTYIIPIADGYWRRAASMPDGSAEQLMALHGARDHYRRAIALRPHSVPYLERYTDILLKIDEVNPADRGARAEAIGALRRAVSADPATTVGARERLESLVGQ